MCCSHLPYSQTSVEEKRGTSTIMIALLASGNSKDMNKNLGGVGKKKKQHLASPECQMLQQEKRFTPGAYRFVLTYDATRIPAIFMRRFYVAPEFRNFPANSLSGAVYGFLRKPKLPFWNR